MILNEAEQEILEKLIDEYTQKHGRQALKDVYNLHKKIYQEIGKTQFPITEIYKFLFYEDLNGKYSGSTVKEISEQEYAIKRSIYNYVGHYHSKKFKEKRNHIKKRAELYSSVYAKDIEQEILSEELDPDLSPNVLLRHFINKYKHKKQSQKQVENSDSVQLELF